MKIGILTFHCAHNYGAVLQCYALQEILKSSGHDVKVVDYRPSYLVKAYKTLRFFVSRRIDRILKNLIVQILKFPRETRRHKAFAKFIEGKLDLSRRCDEKTIVSDMEAYIFGSDQIWNPVITGGGDDIYWGSLPFEKGNKIFIAYAASMGKVSLSKEEQNNIAEKLKNFDFISVRESSLKNILTPLTDKKLEQVLDPTLLAPLTVWDNLEDNVEERGYVLAYQVRQNPNTIEFAKHIAHQLNAKVIVVEAYLNYKTERWKVSCASPEDFVAFIKHASCVVTTSFHGTAFSIIFNKPFYCLELGDGADGRSKSLLHSLHLEDRMVGKLDRPVYSDVDYSEANEILIGLRKSSERFLTQSLN